MEMRLAVWELSGKEQMRNGVNRWPINACWDEMRDSRVIEFSSIIDGDWLEQSVISIGSGELLSDEFDVFSLNTSSGRFVHLSSSFVDRRSSIHHWLQEIACALEMSFRCRVDSDTQKRPVDESDRVLNRHARTRSIESSLLTQC